MPKINVYLPDDLAQAVKEAQIPVSAICQRALAEALTNERTVMPSDGAQARLESSSLTAVTAKANAAITHADHERRDPTSLDLLDGIVEGVDNLGVILLTSHGIDPAQLSQELRHQPQDEADSLTTVICRAVDEAEGLGHGWLGCEHLLLGLAGGNEGELVADALRNKGFDLASGRPATLAALAAMKYQKTR